MLFCMIVCLNRFLFFGISDNNDIFILFVDFLNIVIFFGFFL